MKFSLFTVCTPEYTPEETIKVLKELGYDGVEWRVSSPPPAQKPDNYNYAGRYWSYNHSTLDISKIEEQALALGKLCSTAGLEVTSLTTYLGVSDTEIAERVMRAAKSMGCRNIRITAPGYNEKQNYRTQFENAINQAAELEKLASRYDVRVNFEIHMGNIIPSASAAYRFISRFDPRYMGIIYDPGNMVHEGFENYRLGVELLGEYLAHVHVKNAIWQLSGTSPEGVESWSPTWSPLKKGHADIHRLVRILREAGYNGFVSVEDFSNEQETYEKIKSNLEYLRSL